MALRYSGRVGPKRWVSCGRHTAPGPIGFVVKRFRPGLAGARGCRVWIVRLGSVCVSWGSCSLSLGEPLPLDWHRVLRPVIAWGGGHGHMRPIV